MVGVGRPVRAALPVRRPTLAQIARLAGVSTATVSKVINGREDVSTATRLRVRGLLFEHNYVPVAARRSVVAPVVSLVFTTVDSAWTAEIIRGVEASGVAAVVSSIAAATEPRQWAETIAISGRLGVIVVTANLSDRQREMFDRAGVPVVIIDPIDIQPLDVPTVGAANWAGGLTATRYLVGLGHRRIGAIGGYRDFLCSRARIDGYKAALLGACLPVDSALIKDGDFHNEGGYAAARDLLRLRERPTAIFAGSDAQALGVIEAARQVGLHVPDDLSVIGFDDLPLARWASPPLTTVRQPLEEMGRLAGRIMLGLIAREPLDSHRIEFATKLIVRASTAPPR